MRPILVILAAAVIIGMAYHALSAPNTKSEPLILAPQVAKDARKRVERCMRPRLFILAQRLPNGKLIAVMTSVVMVPC